MMELSWDKIQESDLKEVYSWMMARRLAIPPPWSFSDIGLMVRGVAAGFLYTTNSGIAYLDSFITNPDRPKEERMGAIESIANALVHAAKSHGVSMVVCHSKFDSIVNAAMKIGFADTGPHTGLARRL